MHREIQEVPDISPYSISSFLLYSWCWTNILCTSIISQCSSVTTYKEKGKIFISSKNIMIPIDQNMFCCSQLFRFRQLRVAPVFFHFHGHTVLIVQIYTCFHQQGIVHTPSKTRRYFISLADFKYCCMLSVTQKIVFTQCLCSCQLVLSMTPLIQAEKLSSLFIGQQQLLISTWSCSAPISPDE